MIVKLPLGMPEFLCILACEQIKPAFWHSFNEKALSLKLAKMCGSCDVSQHGIQLAAALV
jgi:hypothetical protein